MVVAAVIVTWMLFWMRRQSAGLSGELRQRVDRALTEGTAFGLAALAFTAVIREGIETSIFLAAQATSAAASASSVLVGALIGLVIAVGLGWVFYTGSRRVNLRSFFRWTGIALVFIAAGLLSHAVHEFIEVAQIGGLVVPGSQMAFDISSVLSHDNGIGEFLRAIFGYTATPEWLTLAAHVGYVVVVLALYLRPVRLVAPPARPAEAPGAGRETAAS
jgi:high-affinity iron transporter